MADMGSMIEIDWPLFGEWKAEFEQVADYQAHSVGHLYDFAIEVARDGLVSPREWQQLRSRGVAEIVIRWFGGPGPVTADLRAGALYVAAGTALATRLLADIDRQSHLVTTFGADLAIAATRLWEQLSLAAGSDPDRLGFHVTTRLAQAGITPPYRGYDQASSLVKLWLADLTPDEVPCYLNFDTWLTHLSV